MPTSIANKMTNKINQDDINKAVWNGCDDFLNHLSGDEGTLQSLHVSEFFLSHLSDDEAYSITGTNPNAFLSHLSGDEGSGSER